MIMLGGITFVILPQFDYIRPTNSKEAIRILTEAGEKAKIFAGGTDLFVQMKKGEIRPKVLIDIKSIHKIAQISISVKDELILGAGVTLGELEQWAKTDRDWYVLSVAARCIGSEQVRNRGTVVGNVCRASPAGDMAPVLIALDGKVEIHGLHGKRSLLVQDFIIGSGQTILTRGEMVRCLRIPKPGPNTGVVYLKLSARRAMDTAIVSVAARITLDSTLKKIRLARIILGAVASTPLRVMEAEEILANRGMTPEILEEISSKAKDLAKPITDLRGTDVYRSEMVRVLTKRAVEQVWREAARGEMH